MSIRPAGRLVLLALLVSLGAGGSNSLAARQARAPGSVDVRIWLDRAEHPVLSRGDRVRVFYRTSEPAWVAVLHVDTNGSVHLISPRSPAEDARVTGGRDLRLLFPRASYWQVDEAEGKGYFFAVASPAPLDLGTLRYRAADRAWDLTALGRRVRGDPNLAMDAYVAALVPGWREGRHGVDVVEYDVGRRHDYPRFLCYDCHGFRSYAHWNPYDFTCTTMRLVIRREPRLHPGGPHGPDRVVPTSSRSRVRFDFERRTAGTAGAPPPSPGGAWPVRPPLKGPRVPLPDRPVLHRRPGRPAVPDSIGDPSPSAPAPTGPGTIGADGSGRSTSPTGG